MSLTHSTASRTSTGSSHSTNPSLNPIPEFELPGLVIQMNCAFGYGGNTAPIIKTNLSFPLLAPFVKLHLRWQIQTAKLTPINKSDCKTNILNDKQKQNHLASYWKIISYTPVFCLIGDLVLKGIKQRLITQFGLRTISSGHYRLC